MNGRLEHKIRNEKLIDTILIELPQCVSEYYFSRASSKESKGSAEYLKKIRAFLRFINEDTKTVDVTQITENDVSKYLHSIEQTTDKNGIKRETSFAYRKQIHSILNSFFEYLKKRKIILENPMECIERPMSKDVVKRIPLDSFDINFILECIDNGAGTRRSKNRQENWKSRDKAIITLLAMTGMRETALTEINVSDLDFDKGTITVIDKRHKTHIYKMNDPIKMALRTWLNDRETKLGGCETDALFISNQRKRVNEKTVVWIVEKYSLEGLGYKISPHKLRAAFCTILYQSTGDIEFVRRAVGHSSIETTQRYIVDDDRAKDEAASIMENIFG